jgi:hypothetical protein
MSAAAAAAAAAANRRLLARGPQLEKSIFGMKPGFGKDFLLADARLLADQIVTICYPGSARACTPSPAPCDMPEEGDPNGPIGYICRPHALWPRHK